MAILRKILQDIRPLYLKAKLFFCELCKGYFFLHPAPVTPCVDTCKVYDGIAKVI